MQWTFEDDNEEGEAVGFFFEKYAVFFVFLFMMFFLVL